jgi:hypothetical protein
MSKSFPRKLHTAPKLSLPCAIVALFIAVLSAAPALSATGTFNPVAAVPAAFTNPSFEFLLTDGTVIMQDQNSSTNCDNWWRLSPDNTGSYANGTWTQVASTPTTFSYGPRFYAGAVLPDGRLIIEGGEYNIPNCTSNPSQDTSRGAIYNPQSNQWLPVRPPQAPAPWPKIGDSQTAVLPSGQWLLANGQTTQMALFNANNLTWTPTGFNVRTCTNNEAGWTLLPDGSIFSVDNNVAGGCPATPNGERWVPSSGITPIGTWHIADNGTGTQQLFDACQEMGPQVLLPNKTVLAIGATGKVSIYTPPPISNPASIQPGSWANTTTLPATCGTGNNAQCAANDAPASLLPNGNVLLFAGPAGPATCPSGTNDFPNGSHFYEFNSANNWNQATEPAALKAQVKNDPSYVGQLLQLPNGHVLFTDGIGNGAAQVWDYTPDTTILPNPAWVPTITSFPATINRGATYAVAGTMFNGVSQANFYGDDSQNATNFPIVQVTITTSGHVYYGHTHNHSAMGVNLVGVPVTTKFELLPCPQPLGASCVPENGAATLVVIANGIKSAPVSVTIN